MGKSEVARAATTSKAAAVLIMLARANLPVCGGAGVVSTALFSHWGKKGGTEVK